jgi:hypothetical protein
MTMKKFIALFCSCFVIFPIFSQDLIIQRDGTEIKSKVTEITTNEIKFKSHEFLTGPTRTIAFADVFMVIYENGNRETFTDTTFKTLSKTVRESSERLNKLSVNPIQLALFNNHNIEYERGFKQGKLGIAFYLGRAAGFSREISDTRMVLSEQNVTVKWYLNTINRSSFWYGGALSVASGSIIIKDKGSAFNIGTLGLSGRLGYQFIIKSFYLDPSLGIGYALTNDLFDTLTEHDDVELTNLILVFGLKMGIVF